MQINTLGLIFAFILMLILLPLSGYLILKGHSMVGSVFGSATMIAIITAFLSKVKSNNNENTTR